MAVFYIKTKSGDVYELTATTDVSFSHRSSNTKFPVEAGYSVTDHSTIENTTLNMSGVITEVVQLNKQSPQRGIKDYVEGLNTLRKSKELFTVFLDNKLQPFKNCLFTEISGDKGVQEGLGSWRIRLGIEQIRVTSKATQSVVEVENAPSKETSSDSNASDATKDTAGETKDEGNKPTRTIAGKLGVSLGGAVYDAQQALSKISGG